MRQSLHRSYVVSVGLVLSVAASAGAQARVRGEITDEWDNPLEGVTVLAEPTSFGSPKTTTTDEDGRYQFLGLTTGEWSFTATLDGYQGLRQSDNIRTAASNPAMDFEMPVVATGGRFRERTEFEAEGGTPRFRFEEDGTFEFEDADGEGEGTYGIAGLNATLIMREYDGPDDTFSVKTPIVVEFSDDQFSSLTYDGVQHSKK